MLWLAMLILPAVSARPTEGGQFGFEASDEVVSWDSPGGIRVHYSIDGPSVTKLEDADDSGVPDFVEGVGHHVQASLARYAETGFRAPLGEAEVGLGDLGGSGAFDVYLVDFAGVGDGAYRNDACRDGVCAGHLLIENDFVGYGYSDLDEATATLASHELFHAVQAAYTDELEVWVSEGTAVWAERHYDPESRDFLRFAISYLQDAGRSLDRPPAGPTPTFAYATGLWFDFLTLRHGDEAMVSLMEGLGDTGGDPLDRIEDVLLAHDDTWDQAFLTFTTWNLATQHRAGGLSEGGYPYASRLSGLQLESVADRWQDDARVFPLAAVFFAVEHPGGPLWAGSAACEEVDELPAVIVHAAVDGVVQDPLDTVLGPGRLVAGGEELAAGRYFVALTVPRPAAESSRDLICVRDEASLPSTCMCDDETDSDDTDVGPGPGECGCSQAAGSAPAAVILAVLLPAVLRRRRRVPVT